LASVAKAGLEPYTGQEEEEDDDTEGDEAELYDEDRPELDGDEE
jgi:hypothetical protein